MREKIINILQAIELEKKYTQLCQEFCDFEGRANLTRKEVEPIIKSYDPAYKYIARDRIFMKELLFQKLKVRFFIGYQSGITDFGYLIWKEGENHNYQKGDLATLTEMINPKFSENLKFKRPIVSSIEEFEIVISTIFELYNVFKDRFEQLV
jgi:hypothetical protein